MIKTVNQKQVNRVSGIFMHYLGWVMLFAFTGTCTIILFRTYAPPTAPWLPYAGLAVFEFGAIHWLHYHRHNAKNVYQFLIGLAMTGVSMLCISASTGLQLLEWFKIGLPGWVQAGIFWAIVVGVVLNVLAFVGCSLASPEHFTVWAKHNTIAPQFDARDAELLLPTTTVEEEPVVALAQTAELSLATQSQYMTKADLVELLAALKAQPADPTTAPLPATKQRSQAKS